MVKWFHNDLHREYPFISPIGLMVETTIDATISIETLRDKVYSMVPTCLHPEASVSAGGCPPPLDHPTDHQRTKSPRKQTHSDSRNSRVIHLAPLISLDCLQFLPFAMAPARQRSTHSAASNSIILSTFFDWDT